MDGKMVTIPREKYDELINYEGSGVEKSITVPLSRYEELLNIETRAGLLADFAKKETYSVSRENVAHYLGFRLPVDTKTDGK